MANPGVCSNSFLFSFFFVYFLGVFAPLLDRTVRERQETGMQRREDDMQQWATGGFKSGLAAARTKASARGVHALPTELSHASLSLVYCTDKIDGTVSEIKATNSTFRGIFCLSICNSHICSVN